MSVFRAGTLYPADPRSLVWSGGRYIDGISATGLLPEHDSLIDIDDVEALWATLAGKSNVGHGHTPADIVPPATIEIVDGGTFF